MLKELSPLEFPRDPVTETWFYVHPNNPNVEFYIPEGAAAVCLRPLLGIFKVNAPYRIVNYNRDGWVMVESAPEGDLYRMPLYLFVRHFDAESFVRPSESFRYNPNKGVWSD